MSERFKPVFKRLDEQGKTLNTLARKGVGDRVFLLNPIIAIYSGREVSRTETLQCVSSSEENCSGCELKNICPRPFGTSEPIHRNSIPLRTALEYYEPPEKGNPTITNGHPPPINR